MQIQIHVRSVPSGATYGRFKPHRTLPSGRPQDALAGIRVVILRFVGISAYGAMVSSRGDRPWKSSTTMDPETTGSDADSSGRDADFVDPLPPNAGSDAPTPESSAPRT